MSIGQREEDDREHGEATPAEARNILGLRAIA